MRTSDHMFTTLNRLFVQMDYFKGETLQDSLYNVLGVNPDGTQPHGEVHELLLSIQETAQKMDIVSDNVSLAELGDMDVTDVVTEAIKFMIDELEPLCSENISRDFSPLSIPEVISQDLRGSGRLNLTRADL